MELNIGRLCTNLFFILNISAVQSSYMARTVSMEISPAKLPFFSIEILGVSYLDSCMHERRNHDTT